MRLIKFTFEEDDIGNACGLAVEFAYYPNKMNHSRSQRIRNAVVMSKHGKWFDPQETANALRELARWCETLDYNTKKPNNIPSLEYECCGLA